MSGFQSKRLLTGNRIMISSALKASINTNSATLLRCEKLTKTFRDKPQFEDVSLNLCTGSRIGLIGINGAGKSTMLKCLAGVGSPDSGTVEKLKTAKVVFVEQDPIWAGLVSDFLFEGRKVFVFIYVLIKIIF